VSGTPPFSLTQSARWLSAAGRLRSSAYTSPCVVSRDRIVILAQPLLSGGVRRECTFFGASSRCERGHFDDQYRRQGDEQRPTSDHAVSQSGFLLWSYPLLTVMRHPFRARGNAVINSVPPAPGAISHKTPDCYASPQCKDRRARDRQWLWSIEGLCR
jgi:hypothetical protein